MAYQKDDLFKYIDILQSAVARMAGNSAKCKSWCITLVSVLFLFISKEDVPGVKWIIFMPLAAMWFLDAYYLHLERGFRNIYDKYINEYHGDDIPESTYKIDPAIWKKRCWRETAANMFSASLLPFYGVVTLAVLIAVGGLQLAFAWGRIVEFFRG